MKKQGKRKPLQLVGTISMGLLIVAVWLFYLFPIFWLVLGSFKTRTDMFAIPPKWVFTPTLSNYALSFGNPEFTRAVKNSLVVTVITVVLTLVLAAWAAYAFARFRFKGALTISFALIIARMMPPVVFIIPLFLMFDKLQLRNTHLGLILIFTTFSLPFAVWMLRSFFEEITEELEEAAWIDGASRLQGFFRIVLPLAAPGLAATAVFVALLAWNEFLYALILSGPETYTLPVFLSSFVGERVVNWGGIMSAAVLSILPPVLLAMLVQRNMIKGLTLGAVKG